MSIVYRQNLLNGEYTMDDYVLGTIESRFADIIWKMEPITTSELTKICEKELGWKRTTTYTVLKKLNTRQLFENRNGTVTSLISREEFYARQSERYIKNSFDGSLPSFLTAFTSRQKLSSREIEQIKKIIEK